MAIPIIEHPIPGKPGLTPLDPGGPKLVLHTTEAGDPARYAARDLAYITNVEQGILATWDRLSGFPTQYLVTVQTRRAVRCVPDNVASYGLADVAGGVRTNRCGGTRLIQIEMNGHASQLATEWNAEDWTWLGQLLRQLCADNGIPYTFPHEFVQSPLVGGDRQRLDAATYQAATGILGHQHVPENNHSDPGLIRLDLLVGDTTMQRRIFRFTHQPDDLFIGDLEVGNDGTLLPRLVENVDLTTFNYNAAKLTDPTILDMDPSLLGACTCIGPAPGGTLTPNGTWPFSKIVAGMGPHTHPDLAPASHAHPYAPTTHTHPATAPAPHTHTELAPATHGHTAYSPTTHTHPAPLPSPHVHTIPGTTTNADTKPA